MQQIHQLPGRIRIRSLALKQFRDRDKQILATISGIAGVKTVKYNAIAGSLLVYHHPEVAIAAKLLKELKNLELHSNVIGFPTSSSLQVWQRKRQPRQANAALTPLPLVPLIPLIPLIPARPSTPGLGLKVRAINENRLERSFLNTQVCSEITRTLALFAFEQLALFAAKSLVKRILPI